MKYENAKDVLPEDLLKEIQKYIQGKIIYIPIRDERRLWGEMSGYKQYLHDRNSEIRSKFISGVGVDILADEFCLSVESIKRIVYSKKGKKDMRETENEKTMVLSNVAENRISAVDILKIVCSAMEEKQYDPVNQMVGYIVTGDPGYITSYKNARDLIMTIDRDELVRQLIQVCLERNS